jgi:tetratricopeptide (TPR) repeat protein
VYPDARVADFIEQNFIPIRVHVREQRDAFKQLGERYSAQWTPTILILDANGQERHRIEGFLPTDDFVAQLILGLGHAAFAESNFAEAESRFNQVVEQYPNSDAAAEALYWKGVSRYKATGDPSALAATATAFSQRYRDTPWAKKASVWAK